MTNKDNKSETLTVNRPNKLSLTKTVESGKVKQNFTHGRSKTVTVEVKKTRTFARNSTGGMVEVQQPKQPKTPRIRLPQVRLRRKKNPAATASM